MKRLLISLHLIAAVCVLQDLLAEKLDFSGIDSAQQIFGGKISSKDLENKVVFLEYWGINCPPCRSSIPHLVQLQSKYFKTGKFTVLASHVQRDDAEASKFCGAGNVNFPVYQQYRNEQAPCGQGIPCAFIIDHNGELVEQGHPSSLIQKVDKYVQEAPSPLLAGIESEQCKPAVEAVKSGTPLCEVVKILEKISGNNDASELLKRIEGLKKSRKEEIEKSVASNPIAALRQMEKFMSDFEGSQDATAVKASYDKISSNPPLKEFLAIRASIDKAREKLAKSKSAANSKPIQKSIDSQKAKLKKIVDNPKTPPEIAKGVKDYLSTL